MTELNLDEIRARVEKAAPGPWMAFGTYLGVPAEGCTCGYSDVYGHEPHCGFEEQCNVGGAFEAEFIAHAREDVPALIAEVEQLRERAAVAWDEGRDAAYRYTADTFGDPARTPVNPYRQPGPEPGDPA